MSKTSLTPAVVEQAVADAMEVIRASWDHERNPIRRALAKEYTARLLRDVAAGLDGENAGIMDSDTKDDTPNRVYPLTRDQYRKFSDSIFGEY